MSTHDPATEDTSVETFEWRPAELLRRRPSGQDRGASARGYALVVLNQPLPADLGVVRTLWENAQLRVAADGGANVLYHAAGERGDSTFDALDVIIGDLDSLTADAQAYFTRHPRAAHVLHDSDQESTDFGKAVAYVRSHSHRHQNHHQQKQQQQQQHQHQQQQKPQHPPPPRNNTDDAPHPLDIVALGGLGGRVDQALSQVHHLYLFQQDARYAAGRVYLFSGESLTWVLKRGRHCIRVRDGDGDGDGVPRPHGDGGGDGGEGDVFGKHVGILPVAAPSRITTRGLEWDVRDWETRFGGLVSTSNHVLPGTEVVEVETSGDVLWTMAVRQG